MLNQQVQVTIALRLITLVCKYEVLAYIALRYKCKRVTVDSISVGYYYLLHDRKALLFGHVVACHPRGVKMMSTISRLKLVFKELLNLVRTIIPQ